MYVTGVLYGIHVVGRQIRYSHKSIRQTDVIFLKIVIKTSTNDEINRDNQNPLPSKFQEYKNQVKPTPAAATSM